MIFYRLWQGYWSQNNKSGFGQHVRLIFPYAAFIFGLIRTKRGLGKHNEEKCYKFIRKNVFGWISTYLNVVESMWMFRETVSAHLTSKFVLLFLWSDTWIVSGKTCGAWQREVQFLPGAGDDSCVCRRTGIRQRISVLLSNNGKSSYIIRK